MRYGNLTIIKEYKSRYKCGQPCRRFECICDCGSITNPEKNKVLRGVTRSCGCLQKVSRNNFGKRRSLSNGESAINQIFSSYKKTAKSRGYEFLLSKELFLSIITKPCIYCGESNGNKLQRKNGNGSFSYTGIDRYNNSIGYTLENSVPCCRICNRIKTNMTISKMKEHLNKIINNINMWQRTA